MRLNKRIKYLFLFILSISYSIEKTEYQFEIFSIPGDAITHALAGLSAPSSISLNEKNVLDHNNKKGQTLFSYGNLYSNRIKYFQISHILKEGQKYKMALSIAPQSSKSIKARDKSFKN